MGGSVSCELYFCSNSASFYQHTSHMKYHPCFSAANHSTVHMQWGKRPACADTWLHVLLLYKYFLTSGRVQKGNVQHASFVEEEMFLFLFSYTFCVVNEMSKSIKCGTGNKANCSYPDFFKIVFNCWGRISYSSPTCWTSTVSPSTEILQHFSCDDKGLIAILFPQSFTGNSIWIF